MGLELDEIIYGRFVKFLKRKRKRGVESLLHRVTLDEINPRLTLLARALTGKAISIFPAEREGGYKNNNFFLPTAFAEFETIEQNVGFYLYRTLFLAVQQELDFNHEVEVDDVSLSRVAAEKAAPQILAKLIEDYPASQELHSSAKQLFEAKATEKVPADYSWLYGKFMRNAAEGQGDDLENFDDAQSPKPENPNPDTIKNAGAVEEIKSLTIDKKQQEDYVLMHNFEKVETAEEFGGNWRDFDGSDQLDEHQNALEEMNMKFTVRVDESLYFPNARFLEDFVQDKIAENTAIRHLVLMFPAVNEVDSSALESLEAINLMLKASNVTLHMSEVKGPVMDRLRHSHFMADLTGDVFLTQYDAMERLAPELSAKTLAAGRRDRVRRV
jgi:nitric oxide reductase NorD protein